MFINETTKALAADSFHYLCDLEIKKAQRYQYFISVLFIQFDTQDESPVGAPRIGNPTLEILGKILRDEIRECDLLARLGDNRLCILLPFTDGSNSMGVAERLRSRVENHSFSDTDGQQKTVSVSVACYPTNASDSASLLIRADETLLRVLEVGGNRVAHAE
jgi:two-component system cell cycle response regulator